MRKPMERLVSAALVAAVLLWAADKGPDAGGYTATDNAVYSFVDPAGGGGVSVLAGVDDDGVALLTLPFAFQFYGHSYTMVCVSDNGLLYFVSAANACVPMGDFANTDLSVTAVPGDLPAILPFWTDLSFQVPGAGAVYYQSVGAAGSRRFVIDWYNAYPANSENPVTFEVLLLEGSNNILFQYQTVDLGAGNPASKGALSTVGVRDAAGNTNDHQIQWSSNAAVLGNGSAILFTAPGSAPVPVLTVSKTADAAAVSTGSPIGYTITVSNSNAAGTGKATGVVLADPLPAGTGISWSISPPYAGAGTCVVAGAAGSQALACSVGDLAAGSSVTVHVISATTAASCGAYTNTITVTAANSAPVQSGATTTVQCAPLTISGPDSLPAGTLNTAYTSTTISANGGLGSYTWSASGLPAGLGIGPSSGTIAGTPTTGTGSPFTVDVTVTDSSLATATQRYSLTIVTPNLCDVNQDTFTNVVDVQLVINEALGVVAAVHDLNKDTVVNVVDVQILINAALGLGCSAR